MFGLFKSKKDDLTPQALFQKAVQFQEVNRYTEAFQVFQQAAEKGHADAMAFVGNYYIFGEYVAKDIETGMNWYAKSAENGCVDAFLALALIYEEGRYDIQEDIEKAKSIYRDLVSRIDILPNQAIVNTLNFHYYNTGSMDEVFDVLNYIESEDKLKGSYAQKFKKWAEKIKASSTGLGDENSPRSKNDCLTSLQAFKFGVGLDKIIDGREYFNEEKGFLPCWRVTDHSHIYNLKLENESEVNWVKSGWYYIADSASPNSPWKPVISFCKSNDLVLVFRYMNRTVRGYEEGKSDPEDFYNSPGWIWCLKTPKEAINHPNEPFFYQDNIGGNDRTMEGAFNVNDTPLDHPLSPVTLEITQENWENMMQEWAGK